MRFSMLLGIIGGISGTYVASLLSNKGKANLIQTTVGTITGGITIASAAPYISNLGIAIGIGFFGAVLSVLLKKPIHNIINKNRMYDPMGLIGPILVSSLIGTLVIPAAVLAYCISKSIIN